MTSKKHARSSSPAEGTFIKPEKKQKKPTAPEKPDKALALQRKIMQCLRDPATTPDTILLNGQPAGLFATTHLLTNHALRCNKKEKL